MATKNIVPRADGEGSLGTTAKCWGNVRADNIGNDTLSAPVVDVLTSLVGTIIDGGGSAITTGVKAYVTVPWACTITKVELFADQTGSIVIDIWKDTYANFPPLVADTITAAAKPTISSGVKDTDSTLTGWTTALAAGDVLAFNVDSVTDITRLSVLLTVVR